MKLKFWAILIAVMAGCLVGLLTEAYIEDNFDDLSVGDLYGQTSWNLATATWFYATTTQYDTSPNSVWFSSDNGGMKTIATTTATTTSGSLEVDFYSDDFSDFSEIYKFLLYDQTPDLFAGFQYTGAGSGCIGILANGGYDYSCNGCCALATGTWHNVILEFEDIDEADGRTRISVDSNDFSDWFDLYATGTRTYWLEISVGNNDAGGDTSVYFDTILGEYGCEEGHCDQCDSWNDCENAGCYWWQFDWTSGLYQESYCSDIPLGECGEGIFSCQNCLSSTTCETYDLCYWGDDDFCHFGTSTCGEGLNCQFCENSGDCSGAGCFWYDDFCWITDKEDDLLDWNTYYGLYGDYATPSEWISSVASTTGNFFAKIGGFLNAFVDNFDLIKAKTYGSMLGSAIPTARSMASPINDLLGGFPIAEIVIFVIIFIMAVGVFRIVQKIITMIKPT